MSFTILPPIEPKNVHQGCLCCPVPSVHAEMDKMIAVGFGGAQCTRDGDLFYDGESDYTKNGESLTVQAMETAALEDPDHDWRIEFYGPLHGETYQRQGEGKWVMVESNMGFA